MNSNKNTQKILSLEVIRSVAFLCVFLYHVIRTFPGEGSVYNFISTSLGPWGVSVFFVLSGFVMTYSYWYRCPIPSIKNNAKFAIRKIKKLYPLHIIMLLICSFRLLMHKETMLSLIKRLCITVPLLQTWFPVEYQAINSVAWYLSVCLFLYFCFPYVLTFVKKGKVNPVIGIISIIIIQALVGFLSSLVSFLDITWITYCHPVYRLGDFIVGCYLSAIFLHTVRNRNKSTTTIFTIIELLTIMLSFIVCVLFTVFSEKIKWLSYTVLFLPSSIFLVFIYSFNLGLISKISINKVSLWLAKISPYGFLIHREVAYYIRDGFIFLFNRYEVNLFFVVIFAFVITILLIYIYIYISKKINVA